MIPLVFILAVVLIAAAIVLFVVDRRRRNERTTATRAVDSASTQVGATSSLDDESTSPTGEVPEVAAEEVALTQPDSADQVEQAEQVEVVPSSADAVEIPADDAVIVDEVEAENAGDAELQAPQSATQASSESESADRVIETEDAGFVDAEVGGDETDGGESDGGEADGFETARDKTTSAEAADEPVDDAQGAPAETTQPAQPAQLARPAEPSQPAAATRHRLSGRKVRHLRKQWAQQRNATYNRVDHELPSYWQRTPEGDAKAVVSGFAFGREMHLADVGGITTLAIRRSVASDEVFELRRSGDTTLPHVATEAGLVVAATDPELIHRIFDERATRMLVDVHPVITRMWSENSWSLAQLIDGTVIADWDAALTSLADFSDIARRLPPAEGETVAPDTEQWDPTRLQLTEQESESGRGHLQAVPTPSRPHTNHDDGDEPLDVEAITATSAAAGDEMGEQPQRTSQSTKQTHVQAIDSSSWRPQRDTPLDPTSLPSRSTARKMGSSVGESEEIGDADQQIPALGEDPEHSHMRSSKGRVVRSNVKPASIFTDMKSAPDSAEE
ncbi:MAG: hypothetical protein Q4E11_04620 [Corynebacterium sp.]|uniref:hypothetical protein n=1 Tax=Corynebacterium sp. TaxID=1720 RepID=UPI0026DBF925|nr:hypothetical protein [Corynebacterium sp.]MDO5029850.1 hypothetical protein [Corynebacterium sp.]